MTRPLTRSKRKVDLHRVVDDPSGDDFSGCGACAGHPATVEEFST